MPHFYLQSSIHTWCWDTLLSRCNILKSEGLLSPEQDGWMLAGLPCFPLMYSNGKSTEAAGTKLWCWGTALQIQWFWCRNLHSAYKSPIPAPPFLDSYLNFMFIPQHSFPARLCKIHQPSRQRSSYQGYESTRPRTSPNTTRLGWSTEEKRADVVATCGKGYVNTTKDTQLSYSLTLLWATWPPSPYCDERAAQHTWKHMKGCFFKIKGIGFTAAPGQQYSSAPASSLYMLLNIIIDIWKKGK